MASTFCGRYETAQRFQSCCSRRGAKTWIESSDSKSELTIIFPNPSTLGNLWPAFEQCYGAARLEKGLRKFLTFYTLATSNSIPPPEPCFIKATRWSSPRLNSTYCTFCYARPDVWSLESNW